jgi:hypothetical protein
MGIRTIVEDEAGGKSFGRGEEGFDLLLDLAERGGFGGAAVVVEAVKFFGEGAGGGGVAREEELDDVAGDLHAAGGVEAGREAEADVGGGDGAGGVDAGELHERAETGLRGAAEFSEADVRDGAVFAGERDGVGDGGDGEELKEAREGFGAEAIELDITLRSVASGAFEEGLCEFEGDGGSAEILAGVGAVGLVGVEHGEGVGDAVELVGEMVVGDDEVEGEARGLLGGGVSADAGVDGDDEADAFGCGVGYAGFAHAVAFADAVRNVITDVGCDGEGGGGALDGGLEENGGDGAVDVVVAVDKDGLAREQGAADAVDGGAHAVHRVGVVEVGELGREEAARGGDVSVAAGDEQARDGLGEREFAGEGFRGGGGCSGRLPSSVGGFGSFRIQGSLHYAALRSR